jgi:hypothetical protein
MQLILCAHLKMYACMCMRSLGFMLLPAAAAAVTVLPPCPASCCCCCSGPSAALLLGLVVPAPLALLADGLPAAVAAEAEQSPATAAAVGAGPVGSLSRQANTTVSLGKMRCNKFVTRRKQQQQQQQITHWNVIQNKLTLCLAVMNACKQLRRHHKTSCSCPTRSNDNHQTSRHCMLAALDTFSPGR